MPDRRPACLQARTLQRTGRSPDWFKMKNSDEPSLKREAEEIGAKRSDRRQQFRTRPEKPSPALGETKRARRGLHDLYRPQTDCLTHSGSCRQRGPFGGCSATSLFFASGSRTVDSRRRSHSDLRRARTVGPFHSRADLSEGSFLFLLPAPGERFRGGLLGCLVTMRRRAIFILAVGERPHPGRSWRRRDGLEDAPDNKSARTDDVVVVGASLFTPRSALRNVSKQKVGHRSQSSSASRFAARGSGLIVSRLVAAISVRPSALLVRKHMHL
jgi:hypothetical protein